MAVEVDDVPGGEIEVKQTEKKHSIKATVLDSFTLLANNSESTRINGGVKLLGYLFTNSDAKESEKEASYALNRLIRGIATNRPNARQGFFTALTVYLANQTSITINSLIKVLIKELPIGGQSKSETGEICTGHVLTCGAVLRSGLFLRSSEEEQALLVSTMLTAAAKKAYLGLVAYSFIVDFVNTNSEEDVTAKLWPHLKEPLSKPLVEHSMDSLYCLLTVSGRFPALTKKIVKKKMGLPAIFCPETVSVICDKLMNAPDFPSVHHPIYEIFGKEIAKSEHLVLFWTSGLEIKLSLRNQNRSIIALTILDGILKNVSDHAKEIPRLLSDRFIPNILEWFKGFKSAGGKLKKYRGKQQRYEDEEENNGRRVILKAKDVFDTLVDTLKKESIDKSVSLGVLKNLLFYPGDIMFGEITNSKLIRSAMDELNVDGVKEFADILKKVIANESKKVQSNKAERPWTNTERLRAAEMFTHLVNHKATAENIKWRVKKMQFLLRISLFKTSGHDESASVSSELAAAVKKCFFRCLNFTLPKLETLLRVLTALVDYTDDYLSNDANLTRLTKPISPKTLESWKAMREFTKTLVASASSDSSKANTVFQILSLHSGLFLFADVMSEEMASSSLQEVQSCYDHYIKDRKGSKKKKVVETSEGDIIDEEPEWIEVLVDVFLNFLSRDSFLLRSVVQCVFRLLCEYLTPSAIGQIVSVLDPDSDTNPLSQHGDKSDEEDDNSGSEGENDEENAESGDEEKDSDNEYDEESSADDETEDNTTVTDQFRMAVQKALGSAAPETDTESIDADNIGEEEGRKLDEALSIAFKQLKQSKGKKTKKDKKNDKVLMDFRIRVLDLIDIYLEKEPSMELCLGMLSPLSRCLEFSIKDSDQQPLEAKVRKCIKCLTAVKSFSSSEGVTMQLLAEYLQAVTNRGSRTQFVFQALGDVVSKCSTFIVRCSQKIKPTETPSKKKKKHKPSPVVEIYKECLTTFFTKRDCLLPVILFHEVLQLNWDGNWEILPVIIDHCFAPGVRQFRKNEGLEMINIFYKNLKRSLRTESAQDISAKLKPIEEKLCEYVISNFKSNTEANERFFAILMKLFVTIKNYHSSVKESIDNMSWDEMKPIVQQCRQCIKLRNTQDYFKFCNLFGLDKIKNKVFEAVKTVEKESTDSGHDSNTDGDAETKPETKKEKKLKRKQKLNGSIENGVASDDEDGHEKQKRKPIKRVKKEISKKEAKQLRAQASSEGLEQVSFSNLLEANIDVDDIGEQTLDSDDNKSKKRKQSDDTHIKKKSKKIKNDL